MAKIVRKQETEINLEEVIRLIKKNWDSLAGYISYDLLGKKTVRAFASFNLVDINDNLRRTEGLVAQINELEEAIVDIFREIEGQNPHLKNMTIERSAPHRSSDISFDIDIAITPIMPVDPIDIPGSDNVVDPNSAKRAEIMQLVH